MKITPLEIRQHEFEKTFRGYNIEEVDNFLSNISQEWERVLNESKMLRMQLEIAEKEANKLREIEMTLFKTLKTAEDTSTMITEQANQQADKHVQEARLKGEQIIHEAQEKAASIIRQAEGKAKYIKDEVLGDVKILEKDFKAMDHYKSNLMVQMKSLANATLDHVQRFEQKFDKEGIEAKFEEATSLLNLESAIESKVENVEEVAPKVDLFVERPTENVVSAIENIEVETSSNQLVEDVVSETTEVAEPQTETVEIIENTIEETVEEVAPVIEETVNIEQPIVETFIAEKASLNQQETDDLSIIEGIGPKIANILFDNGIFTFRQLATTPVYKIREMLDEAGPHYAMHDPSTWVEQALLAAEERWNELDILKDRLIGGRDIEAPIVDSESPAPIAEPVVETTIEEVKTEVINTPIVEETVETEKSFFDFATETKVSEQIAEEPLEEIVNEEPKGLEKTLAERFGRPQEAIKNTGENNLEAITEEMLEKVNKVKLAIRKAMVEKADSPIKDTSPLPTVNDVISKKSDTGNSFFDNL